MRQQRETRSHKNSVKAAALGSIMAGSFESGDEELGWRNDFERCYVQGATLGSGSFGSVFLGINLQTGAQVAVKVLPKVRGKLTREKTLEKLCREVDMLERLQGYPGIIKLMECFEDSSNVRIVTEACTGGDLQSFAEDQHVFDEPGLAKVAVEVLKTIKYCHERGLLHGDVKPANFCINSKASNPLTHSGSPAAQPKNWLKAIDFGCSQQVPAHRRLSKRTGTPVYMAPELFNRDYHFEADMWSLGIMLYQLYARRFPFWNSMEECRACKLEEVSQAVAGAAIPFDYGPWEGMSLEGIDFLRRCLTRSVEDRMTVQEAMAHPWLAGLLAEPTQASSNNIVASAAMGGVTAAVLQNVSRGEKPASAA